MKNIFVLALTLFVVSKLHAQNTFKNIYLVNAKFTYPLIEKWVSEYQKVNPGVKFRILTQKSKTDSIDLKVVASIPGTGVLRNNEQYIRVNRYALLPVANVQNQNLKKVYKKGLDKEEFKKYFFIDTAFSYEPDVKKVPLYNVYAPAEQASTSITFSSYYGFKSSALKGKKILGDDKYLISAILKDSIGITFNLPGNIFDIKSRKPVPGIKIIPIDLNGNGKIDSDELDINDLDKLTSTLEVSDDNNSVPTNTVGFVVNRSNPELTDFVNWVLKTGKSFNHEFGYIQDNNRSFVSLLK